MLCVFGFSHYDSSLIPIDGYGYRNSTGVHPYLPDLSKSSSKRKYSKSECILRDDITEKKAVKMFEMVWDR